MMSDIKFCNECIWSVGETYTRRCSNPKVNAKNTKFLVDKNEFEFCVIERTHRGLFAPCGRKGKLWSKNTTENK